MSPNSLSGSYRSLGQKTREELGWDGEEGGHSLQGTLSTKRLGN